MKKIRKSWNETGNKQAIIVAAFVIFSGFCATGASYLNEPIELQKQLVLIEQQLSELKSMTPAVYYNHIEIKLEQKASKLRAKLN